MWTAHDLARVCTYLRDSCAVRRNRIHNHKVWKVIVHGDWVESVQSEFPIKYQ